MLPLLPLLPSLPSASSTSCFSPSVNSYSMVAISTSSPREGATIRLLTASPSSEQVLRLSPLSVLSPSQGEKSKTEARLKRSKLITSLFEEQQESMQKTLNAQKQLNTHHQQKKDKTAQLKKTEEEISHIPTNLQETWTNLQAHLKELNLLHHQKSTRLFEIQEDIFKSEKEEKEKEVEADRTKKELVAIDQQIEAQKHEQKQLRILLRKLETLQKQKGDIELEIHNLNELMTELESQLVELREESGLREEDTTPEVFANFAKIRHMAESAFASPAIFVKHETEQTLKCDRNERRSSLSSVSSTTSTFAKLTSTFSSSSNTSLASSPSSDSTSAFSSSSKFMLTSSPSPQVIPVSSSSKTSDTEITASTQTPTTSIDTPYSDNLKRKRLEKDQAKTITTRSSTKPTTPAKKSSKSSAVEDPDYSEPTSEESNSSSDEDENNIPVQKKSKKSSKTTNQKRDEDYVRIYNQIRAQGVKSDHFASHLKKFFPNDKNSLERIRKLWAQNILRIGIFEKNPALKMREPLPLPFRKSGNRLEVDEAFLRLKQEHPNSWIEKWAKTDHAPKKVQEKMIFLRNKILFNGGVLPGSSLPAWTGFEELFQQIKTINPEILTRPPFVQASS